MGSWSENCGFSGIEVSESDHAYVMLLKGPVFSESYGPFTVWQPATTLIRGSYNDYGYLSIEDDQEILDIFNQQAGLELKQNDDFSLDELDGRDLQRFWIHADVFDGLGKLAPEDKFVYSRKDNKSIDIKDLEEMLAFYREQTMEKIREFQESIAEIRRTVSPALQDDRLFRAELMLMRLELLSGEGRSNVKGWYSQQVEELLKTGKSVDALYRAKSRNDLLEAASYQLRKKICPSEGGGPQHGGEEASRQFAQMILDIQAVRKPDEEED